MGREGKNRPLARAGCLAWSPPTGRRAPGLADYTGGLFLFGNERAAALGVPQDQRPKISIIYARYVAPMVHNPNNNHRRSKGFRRQQQNRKRDSRNFAGQVIGLSLLAGVLTWQAAPQVQSLWARANKSPEEVATIERSAYYRNCDDARAAGAAPIYRGQPGYREEMDGDFDGIACEPYRGR
jgi:hypothetical protein